MSDCTGYVLSKYERDKLPAGITLICLAFPIAVGMLIHGYLKKPGVILHIYGFFVVGIMFFLCIYGFINKKYRYARYSFFVNSVQLQIGKQKRILFRDDPFFITSMNLLFGERYGSYTEKFFVLWKEGTKPPAEESSPYLALKKSGVILLPYDEAILRMLQDSFGVNEVYEYPKYSFLRTEDGRRMTTIIKRTY